MPPSLLFASIPLYFLMTLVSNNVNHCRGFNLHHPRISLLSSPSTTTTTSVRMVRFNSRSTIDRYEKRRYRDGDRRYHLWGRYDRHHPHVSSISYSTLCTSSSDDDIIPSSSRNNNNIGTWNVSIRRSLSVLSFIGLVETTYLTVSKYIGDGSVLLCGAERGEGGCGDVLNGPYGMLHVNGMDVPLSLLGLFAYGITTLLLLSPIDSTFTRSSLLFVTTVMSTVSLFLLSLLFFVLHASCPYCLLSASLSLSLGISLGILLDGTTEVDKRIGASGVLAGIAASVVIFASVPSNEAMAVGSSSSNAPPTITTVSSERALSLGREMNELHATMYGAFWCSHCYDQKQALGKEVFETYVSYVECDKEGRDSRRALCKEKDVPGYPTWEIGGKLYPGERSLDELEELVKEIRDK